MKVSDLLVGEVRDICEGSSGSRGAGVLVYAGTACNGGRSFSAAGRAVVQ